jgi:hypothetical protein
MAKRRAQLVLTNKLLAHLPPCFDFVFASNNDCFSCFARLQPQAHLLEIPYDAGVRSFHINRADCIGADNTITHRTVDGEIVTETFLTTDSDKDIVMGVTSGASTRKYWMSKLA